MGANQWCIKTGFFLFSLFIPPSFIYGRDENWRLKNECVMCSQKISSRIFVLSTRGAQIHTVFNTHTVQSVDNLCDREKNTVLVFFDSFPARTLQ